MRIVRFVESVFFTLLNKLRFGSRLQMDGIQKVRSDTEFIIKSGQICMGKHVALHHRVAFAAIAGGKVTVGNMVTINRNCMFICHEKIEIADNCIFGPNVIVYDHDHVFGAEGYQQGYRKGEVVIGEKCWIGAGVTILRDTHIGEGCVIGAGVVVKGDIPPYSLVTADRSMKIVPLRDK